jgi:hypothetical protein
MDTVDIHQGRHHGHAVCVCVKADTMDIHGTLAWRATCSSTARRIRRSSSRPAAAAAGAARASPRCAARPRSAPVERSCSRRPAGPAREPRRSGAATAAPACSTASRTRSSGAGSPWARAGARDSEACRAGPWRPDSDLGRGDVALLEPRRPAAGRHRRCYRDRRLVYCAECAAQSQFDHYFVRRRVGVSATDSDAV